jgi:hypothetical protein
MADERSRYSKTLDKTIAGCRELKAICERYGMREDAYRAYEALCKLSWMKTRGQTPGLDPFALATEQASKDGSDER